MAKKRKKELTVLTIEQVANLFDIPVHLLQELRSEKNNSPTYQEAIEKVRVKFAEVYAKSKKESIKLLKDGKETQKKIDGK